MRPPRADGREAPETTAMNHLSDKETEDPHYADRRNFYKVEKLDEWPRHETFL